MTSPSKRATTSALGRWLSGLHERLTRHHRVMSTERALQELPDWALRDIGLHRSEINGVAKLKHLKDRG